MGDAISDHYSKPHQSGGYYKKMGIKSGYAIPIIKQPQSPYLERTTGDKAHVGVKDYERLSDQTRKVQHLKKRKYSSSDSDSDEIEKHRTINKQKKYKKTKKMKKPKNSKKHKRSKIDEALGSDTY